MKTMTTSECWPVIAVSINRFTRIILEILLVPIKGEQEGFTVSCVVVISMHPVSLGESAESAVESIGSDSECGSLVVALRVERRRLEAVLCRSI